MPKQILLKIYFCNTFGRNGSVIVDSITGCLGGRLFRHLGLVAVNLGVRICDEQESCLLRLLLGPH